MRVTKEFFGGAAHVFNGDLGLVVKDLLIYNAKRTIVTANVTALTDNSGGAAADGTIGAIPAVTGFTETGTASAQKAELETSFGAVKDAITELGTKAEELLAILPAATFADNSGGTTADNTIAAIDMSMTAVNTSIAAIAGVRTVRTNVMNAIATLAEVTNKLRAAVGLAAIVDNSGGTVLYADGVYTIPALSVGTGTAVDGSAASGTSKTQIDAMLVAMGAAVKELSTALNAVRAVTAPATTAHVAA